MTLCHGAIIEDDVPTVSWSVASDHTVEGFVLLVHEMVFRLVLAYGCCATVSEGATQVRTRQMMSGCGVEPRQPLSRVLQAAVACCRFLHLLCVAMPSKTLALEGKHDISAAKHFRDGQLPPVNAPEVPLLCFHWGKKNLVKSTMPLWSWHKWTCMPFPMAFASSTNAWETCFLSIVAQISVAQGPPIDFQLFATVFSRRPGIRGLESVSSARAWSLDTHSFV